MNGSKKSTSEKDTARVLNGQQQSAQTGERRRTQEEQNEIDEEKRREASRELVSSWMDRLQLISVITTFFASTEAAMIAITTTNTLNQRRIEQASNAAFLGALVLHASSAIVSFLAAFFLVNYRVHEAKKEEAEAEGDPGPFVETPLDFFEVSVDPTGMDKEQYKPEKKTGQRLYSYNPRLVQVGPLSGKPPTNILGRCHSLSVFLATIGFMLAMTGIGCFAWARQTHDVKIFTMTCIAVCVTLGVGILFVPDIKMDDGVAGRILLMRRKDRVG